MRVTSESSCRQNIFRIETTDVGGPFYGEIALIINKSYNQMQIEDMRIL